MPVSNEQFKYILKGKVEMLYLDEIVEVNKIIIKFP